MHQDVQHLIKLFEDRDFSLESSLDPEIEFILYKTLLKGLLAAHDELLCGISQNGAILFANEKFLNYFNMKADYPDDYSFFSLIYPDDCEKVIKCMAGDAFPASGGEFDCRMVSGTDFIRFMKWRVFPEEHLHNNTHVKYFMIGTDITDKRKYDAVIEYYSEHIRNLIENRDLKMKDIQDKIKEEIIKRENIEKELSHLINNVENEVIQLKEIINFTPQQVLVFNGMGNLQYINLQGAESLGSPIHKLIGKDKNELALPPQILEVLNNYIGNPDASGNPLTGNIEITASPRVNYEYFLVPLHDMTGASNSILLILRNNINSTGTGIPMQDISGAGQQLVTDRLTHSFNNLFTILSGNIALARRCQDLETDTSQYLQKIESDMARAKGLINGLSILSSAQKPGYLTAHLLDLVREIARAAEEEAPSSLKLDFHDDLKPVWLDKEELKGIIEGLLMGNDVLRRPAMIVAENVNITCPKGTLGPGDYVRISFHYQNVSVPSEKQNIDCESGLEIPCEYISPGLVAVRAQLMEHGGSIFVLPANGNKLTVSLCIPVRDIQDEHVNRSDTFSLRQNSYVLFMDDDEGIVDITTKLLENIGYSVMTAKKGEDIIKIYRDLHMNNKHVGFVILDLDIPDGMGAIQTLPILKSFDSRIKVILTTGFTNNPIVRKYREYGFTGVITKPYDQKKLAAALAEMEMND